MSPPTPVRGTVSGTVTGVVPGVLPPAVGSPTSCPVDPLAVASCPVDPLTVASRGAQPPFRQISPAAQSAPLLQPVLPTAGWTGTGPPSKAWATPGATPTAASMASPRKTRRRLVRGAPDVIATVSASNLRAFMLSCSLNCGAIWRLRWQRRVDDCDGQGTGLTCRHHWRPRVKDSLSPTCDCSKVTGRKPNCKICRNVNK